MEANQNKFVLKEFLKGFTPYWINFFAAMGIGLLIIIVLTIPMRFLKIIDDDLWSFIVHLAVMCGVLYMRSYRQGYGQNTSIYTFSFKRTGIYTAIVFAVQILLVLIFGVRNGGHAIYIAGPSRWIANYLLALLNHHTAPHDRISSPSPLIGSVLKYVAENALMLSGVSEIASHFHVHPSYLSTAFSSEMRTGLKQYLIHKKISAAKEMLLAGEGVTEVCYKVGFGSSSHFIEIFRDIVGITPGEYRKRAFLTK